MDRETMEKVYLSFGERIRWLWKAVIEFFVGVVLGKSMVFNVDYGRWERLTRFESLDIALGCFDIGFRGYLYRWDSG